MNRRGNGLSADAYAPLIDLAPELADAMLNALREAGIAAYASSSSASAASGSATAETLGGRDSGESLDRLYVDTSMRSTAEDLLHDHLTRLREEYASEPGTADPGGVGIDTVDEGGETLAPAERDDEAVWAEIVASFEAAPADGAMPWPEEENIDEAADDAPRDVPQAENLAEDLDEGDDRTGRLPSARVIKSADPSEAPPASDEDHYVPPPPPPLPEGDAVTRAAWIALLGGPLYLLLTVLLAWEVPGWAAFIAVAAFIGGFVTLVLRMGDNPRGPDDGAVV